MQSAQAGQDDFVRAVLLINDPTLPSGGIKAAAQQYCDQVRASPDGWRLCLQKLHEVALARGSDHVKFWCLNLLNEVASKRYPAMNDEERSVMRRSLMLYVRDVIPQVSQANFLQNKLCTIFVHIVKHDYLAAWPSFFSDFLSMLDKGPEVIDVFVRLLKTIDEEVVQSAGGGGSKQDMARNSKDMEHERCTAIKDRMRERDVPSIVDAIISICNLYHQSRPALVADALDAFSDYVSWIDINLVATERFLTILYAFMNPQGANSNAGAPGSHPSTPTSAGASGSSNAAFAAASPALQAARVELQVYATDCVIEIIDKRMDETKKIRLIQQLRIIDFINTALLPAQANTLLPHQSANPAVVAAAAAQYAERPAGSELTGADKFTQTIASLIESIGTELVESVAKLCKDPSVAASPSGAAQLAEAMQLLEQTLTLSYRFFEHPCYLISCTVLKVYTSYVELLAKRDGVWPWSASLADHLRRIMDGLAHSMAFPRWYDQANGDDEEEQFRMHRKSLQTLFTNITLTLQRRNSTLIVELLAARITDTLQRLSTLPYSSVEVTLRLFYQLAEPLRLKDKAGQEPYRSMVGQILSSAVSSHPHPAISLLYFELVYRYARFLDTNPDFLGPVLASFLDARGIRHPTSPQVRGRAAYYFCRTLSEFPVAVKKQLTPFVESMLKEVQSVIETVLGPNSPNAPGGAGANNAALARATTPAARAAALAAAKNAPVTLVSFEDLGYLCESMGILVSSVVVTAEQCHRFVSLAFHFFRTQLDSAVQPAAQQLWHPHDDERVGVRLAQLIESVSTITKALTHDAARINDLMLDMAHIILQVLKLLPTHLRVTEATIFFTHRLIECHPHLTAAQEAQMAQVSAQTGAPFVSPDGPVLHYVGLVMQLVLPHAGAASIVKIIELLNMIMSKFKKKCENVIDQIFLPTCEKIFEVLASYAHIDQPQTNGVAAAAASGSGSSSPVPLPSAAYSVERQERLLLQKRYYEFLRHLVTSDLVSVFSSSTNARHVRQVLDTVLQGFLSPADAEVHKACFRLIRHLVTAWAAAGAIQADPALHLFVKRDVSVAMFESLCATHFDLSDAGYIAAVRELLEMQKAVCKAIGAEEYAAFMAADLMPNVLHVSAPDVAQHYCRLMLAYNALPQATGSEWKEYQPFWQQLRKQQQR